jgi:DNA-binding SARP family transcriptional activator
MGEMNFRALGPLAVTHHGSDITPTAPKVRQVLAFLLVRRNQIVQAAEFLDELWGSRPPDSAMTTLQTYVYKLRKEILGPSGLAQLHTRPSAYLFEVPDEQVDICEFEQLSRQGRAALENDQPKRATELLSNALSLWRGRALAGVTAGEILAAHITRLEEQRLRILEMRIEADMRLGRHQELISELKVLVFTHPLHERFHGDLMTALSRSGRRYEALDAYQRLRRILIDELGLEPSARLQQLHQSLLKADSRDLAVLPEESAPVRVRPASPARSAPSERSNPITPLPPKEHEGSLLPAGTADLEALPAPSRAGNGTVRSAEPVNGRPMAISSVAGAVVEGPRMYPLASPIVPAQLPPDTPDFTGRRKSVAEIRRYLASCEDQATTARVVSICGMPGVGKSALALHIAHADRAHYPDGQFYADLRDTSGSPVPPAEVLGGFLAAAGLASAQIPSTLEERSKLFRTWSAGRRALIVLDDAAPTQVAPLLPATPNCAALITSRHGLQGLPGTHRVELTAMVREDSVELLTRIVGLSRVGNEPAEADELAELCGHLPLALRCVGARLAAAPPWSLQKMVALLRSSATPLDHLRYEQLDVRSCFDDSYSQLAAGDRSAFRFFSLLPAQGFTAATAAGLLGKPRDTAEAQLIRLTAGHLIEVAAESRTGQTWYRMHKIVRHYARERLEREYTQETTSPDADANEAGWE